MCHFLIILPHFTTVYALEKIYVCYIIGWKCYVLLCPYTTPPDSVVGNITWAA